MQIDILDKKIALIQWLSIIEDESVLNRVYALMTQENQDGWNSAMLGEKESIEAGLLDADSGKLKPESEASAIYGKWI